MFLLDTNIVSEIVKRAPDSKLFLDQAVPMLKKDDGEQLEAGARCGTAPGPV